MSTVVGLDIGSHSIKAVQLKKGKKGVELIRFGLLTFPVEMIAEEIEDLSLFSEAVKELFHQEKIKIKNVVGAISATKSVVIKKLSLPFMSEEELTASIEAEAEQYIPFDINEVNIDFHILREEGFEFMAKKKKGKKGEGEEDEEEEQMDLVLVAAKKDLVEERYQIITGAGLKPVIMDLDIFAVENAYEFNYEMEDEGVIALIDIGSRSTTVNILEDGVTAFTKDVPRGGNKYTQAIQRELNLSFAEAENVKMGVRVSGIDFKDIIPVIITVTKNIAQGIQKIFEVYTLSAHKKIKKVVLSGGGANLEGIEKILGDCLNIPVEFLNPFKKIKVNSQVFDSSYLEKFAPLAAISVGLALRNMDDK